MLRIFASIKSLGPRNSASLSILKASNYYRNNQLRNPFKGFMKRDYNSNMIGFEEGLKGDTAIPGEGPETENLSKTQLYNKVNKIYYLPPQFSRGVVRKWLIDVENERVFRLTHSQIKHFEVDLKPEMSRKVGTQNAALVLKKVNCFLTAQGKHSLGFGEYEVPDLCWLLRIARAVDPTNILELFEKPVYEELKPTISSQTYSKVYWGRRYAAEFLFKNPKVKQNKGFWDEIKTISDSYKMWMSTKMTVEVLLEELKAMTEKMTYQEGNLNDIVSKAAQTLTTLQDESVRPSMIIQGSSLSQKHRDALEMNNRL